MTIEWKKSVTLIRLYLVKNGIRIGFYKFQIALQRIDIAKDRKAVILHKTRPTKKIVGIFVGILRSCWYRFGIARHRNPNSAKNLAFPMDAVRIPFSDSNPEPWPVRSSTLKVAPSPSAKETYGTRKLWVTAASRSRPLQLAPPRPHCGLGHHHLLQPTARKANHLPPNGFH